MKASFEKDASLLTRREIDVSHEENRIRLRAEDLAKTDKQRSMDLSQYREEFEQTAASKEGRTFSKRSENS